MLSTETGHRTTRAIYGPLRNPQADTGLNRLNINCRNVIGGTTALERRRGKLLNQDDLSDLGSSLE